MTAWARDQPCAAWQDDRLCQRLAGEAPRTLTISADAGLVRCELGVRSSVTTPLRSVWIAVFFSGFGFGRWSGASGVCSLEGEDCGSEDRHASEHQSKAEAARERLSPRSVHRSQMLDTGGGGRCEDG
jgi:hypothetical protein